MESALKPGRIDLPLRIVIDDPLPDVAIALQRGASAKAELVGQSPAFDLEVAVDGALPDGRPRLLGPFVQGQPGERFVYLCVGAMAGQAGSPWGGRVKVPLGGISWELIEGVAPGGRLEARIPGRGRGGGPALATVKLLPPGWRPTR